MTSLRYNTMLALLIALVTAATYIATTYLQPPPPPLVVSLMKLTPEQLDALDKQSAALAMEARALSAELQAALECSRAAKTPEAWKACAETR